MNSLQLLEERTFQTYKSRMFASQRLEKRGRAWNVSLLSMTGAATVASVGLLVEPDMYGQNGDLLFVCISIVTLFVSLLVSDRNYKGRSRDLFNSYRRIQRLSTEIEFYKNSIIENDPRGDEMPCKFLERYNDLLDESENHSKADYLMIQSEGFKSVISSGTLMASWLSSSSPYLFLLIPCLMLVPLLELLLSNV